MPEAPDIEVFAKSFKERFAGKKILKIQVVNGKNLKDTQKELSAKLEGKTLLDVYRSGKEFRLTFSNGAILGMHLMLSGDLQPYQGHNKWKSTIVEFHFDDGWSLALVDRRGKAKIELNPIDKDGVDALSKDLNYTYLKKHFKRKKKVKDLITDQSVIRGIGNGYSDDILWLTKIHPDSKADAIPDEKVRELAKTIKKELREASKRIMKAYPGLLTGEVKEFHKVHNKDKTHSPTGAQIIVVAKSGGMMKTYYTDEQILYV